MNHLIRRIATQAEYVWKMASVGSFVDLDEDHLMPNGETKTAESTFLLATDTDGHNWRPRKNRPIPPPLTISNIGSDGTDRLTEFAIIATSPRSPLMQKNLPIRKRAYSYPLMDSIHSYARPFQSPPPEMLSPPSSQPSQSSLCSSMEELDPRDHRVTSSSPYPVSPSKSPSSSGTWSHQWPKFVWQCFITGTNVRFLSNPNDDWHLAEELGIKEALSMQAEHHYHHIEQKEIYAPNGLRYVHCERIIALSEADEQHLLLTMTPDIEGQSDIIVKCSLEHPFYVQEKGWSSFYPELTVQHYGIPCREIEVNDTCLPPSHVTATITTEVFENLKSYDLTPEDTSAVFALSNMAKHKHELLSSMSPPASPTKRQDKPEGNRPKRPMNGFMLFAKKFRVEYTQMYPGKDNRAISVLLGDTWKKMKLEERNVYAEEARILAEEQKKLHPDCWKRKRSMSTS